MITANSYILDEVLISNMLVVNVRHATKSWGVFLKKHTMHFMIYHNMPRLKSIAFHMLSNQSAIDYETWPPLNIKTAFPGNWSHYEDKAVARTCDLYKGIILLVRRHIYIESSPPPPGFQRSDENNSRMRPDYFDFHPSSMSVGIDRVSSPNTEWLLNSVICDNPSNCRKVSAAHTRWRPQKDTLSVLMAFYGGTCEFTPKLIIVCVLDVDKHIYDKMRIICILCVYLESNGLLFQYP